MIFEWVLCVGTAAGLFFMALLLLTGYIKIVVVKQENITEELKRDGVSNKSV